MAGSTLHASNLFPADGVQTSWEFSFDGATPGDLAALPYISPSDVKVEEVYKDADGNPVATQRTSVLIAPNRVSVLGTPIAPGRSVRIYRRTEPRYPLVDYRDRQTVTEVDLDLANRQAIFLAQETRDMSGASLLSSTGGINAGMQQISNVADGVANHDALNVRQFRRALRAPLGEGELPDLPAIAQRANMLLAFNAEGFPYAVAPASGTSADLALTLANTTDTTKGAAIIGRGGQVCATVAELRKLRKDMPSRTAFVLSHSGNGGGGCYRRVDTVLADDNGAVIVADDGGVWQIVWFGSEITPQVWGAKADSVSDDGPAIRAAVAYVQKFPTGGVIKFPMGIYVVRTGSIIASRRTNGALGRVSFVGVDQAGVQVHFSDPAGGGFLLENNQAPEYEGSASYQTVQGMTILSSSGGATNSAGVRVTLGAFIRLERLNIQGFDFGIDLEDVDQSYFEKLSCRFNKRGYRTRKSLAPGPSSTQSNNYTVVSCAFANNSTYGVHIIGGSCFNMIGGDIEYNGSTANDWGLKIEDAGYEGGLGLNIEGVYFEGNMGISDIFIQSRTTVYGPMLSCVHKVSATFNRNGRQPNVNNILCDFGPESTVGIQKLVLIACGFKTFAGYVPSASTPTIAFSGEPASGKNFYDIGSIYTAPVERPRFAVNSNSKDVKVVKGAPMNIPSTVTVPWVPDTFAPFTTWTATMLNDGVVIDEDGLYTISGTLMFASTAAGLKSMTIYKNGIPFGAFSNSGSLDIVSGSVTDRLFKGDIISFSIRQDTGVTLILAGASTSHTRVNIARN